MPVLHAAWESLKAGTARYFATWWALRCPSQFVRHFDPAAKLRAPGYTGALAFAGWSFAGLAVVGRSLAPWVEREQLPPLAPPVAFLPVGVGFCLSIILFISLWHFALWVRSKWAWGRGTPPLGWMWKPLLYINTGLVSVIGLAIIVGAAVTPTPPDPKSIADAAKDWTELLGILILLSVVLTLAVLAAALPYLNTRLVRQVWHGGFVWGTCVPLAIWILTFGAIGWLYGPTLWPERMDEDVRLAWHRTSAISRTQAYHRLIENSCGDLEGLKELLRTVPPSSPPWHVPIELLELLDYHSEMDGDLLPEN